MTWWIAACLLFGTLMVLFALALPAAFAFLGINIVGAWVWLGKDAGLIQLVRNGVASISSFSLTRSFLAAGLDARNSVPPRRTTGRRRMFLLASRPGWQG